MTIAMKMCLLLLVTATSAILSACDAENAAPGNDRAAYAAIKHKTAEIVPPAVAISSADPATAHPASMSDVEVRKGLKDAPDCRFSFSRVGFPVLGVKAPNPAAKSIPGVLKLHGKLVELELRQSSGVDTFLARPDMVAGDIRAQVIPVDDADGEEAVLRFTIRDAVTRHYRGYYYCAS